jgi:hypothetical protein
MVPADASAVLTARTIPHRQKRRSPMAKTTTKKPARKAPAKPDPKLLEELIAEASQFSATDMTPLIHRWETERLMKHKIGKDGSHTVTLAGVTGTSRVSKDTAVQNLTNSMRRELLQTS